MFIGLGLALSRQSGRGGSSPVVNTNALELYSGGNLELYAGGELELYLPTTLELYAGGYLNLYQGGGLTLYAYGIPTNAWLDTNGEPVLDTDLQYILGV